jgi:predicted ATPase/tetratricopeptide (TPR) repeat protein/DNA-binding winged helix-turn-helix (wHTH) protein
MAPSWLVLAHCTVDRATGVITGGAEGRLTPRELQLLGLLADHEGVTVTREALMTAFGYAPTAVSRAVDKAVHSLRARVEAHPDEPVNILTMGGGYRLVRSVVPALPAIPADRDRFVGRVADLERLARALDEARLVCVTGPGGVGKTRLVLHYLAALRGGAGGVFFVDLSGARSRDDIVLGVASQLSLPLAGNDVARIGFAIASRGRCLVALDNLEQVVGAAREVIGAWLDRAPEATFLATSRAVLGVAGERVLELDTLGPDDGRDLFVARAGAVGFVEEDAAIPELVARLDGLPLAIELAAARTRLLSPSELLARLSERFRWLGQPEAPISRHATLRAALDWSWNLLDPWAAAALAQLSVFAGGFTLEAVETVVRLEDGAPWVPDVLQMLVDRSLVARRGGGRFDLLVSVREHAAEKGAAEAEAAAVRHGAWFADFGTDASLLRLHRPGGSALRTRLTRDLANLIAASERAVARGDGVTAAHAARAAWAVLRGTGPYPVGVALLEGALTLPLPDQLRVQVGVRAGHANALAARFDAARAHLDRSIALARSIGDRGLESEGLAKLAGLGRLPYDERMAYAREALALARATGDLDLEAAALATVAGVGLNRVPKDEQYATASAAVALLRSLGSRYAESMALHTLGMAAYTCGREQEALLALDQALDAHRELGNRTGMAHTHLLLGVVHRQYLRPDQARVHVEHALELARACGDRPCEAAARTNLGTIHRVQGRFDEALVSYREALAIHREASDRMNLIIASLQLGIVERALGRCDEALVHLDEALGLARDDRDHRLVSMVQSNVAMTLHRLGRWDEAEVAFDQASQPPLEDANEAAELLARWALLDLDRGQLQRAWGRLREAVRRAPPSPRGFSGVGLLAVETRVEAALGRGERARALVARLDEVVAAMGILEPELAQLVADARDAAGVGPIR